MPSLMAFLEPHIAEKRMDKLIEKLGFKYSHRVEANRFSREIWLIWNNSICLEVLGNTCWFIHTKIIQDFKEPSIYFTALQEPLMAVTQILVRGIILAKPDRHGPLVAGGQFQHYLGILK